MGRRTAAEMGAADLARLAILNLWRFEKQLASKIGNRPLMTTEVGKGGKVFGPKRVLGASGGRKREESMSHS